MFSKKKMRKADREIAKSSDFFVDGDENAVIKIKAIDQDQIFSLYNYDSNEKLNKDLGEFIFEKAKYVPIGMDIKIKLYTETPTDSGEVEDAIKKHFRKEYSSIKNELKRNAYVSVVMFGIGLISLSALLLLYTFFNQFYFTTMIEIATWIFIWEGVDSYFLQRTGLKREKMTFLKLYCGKIEVIKLKANLDGNDLMKFDNKEM